MNQRRRAYLGLDIGTSAVKAALVAESGALLRSVRRAYRVSRDTGAVELSMSALEEGVLAAIRDVTRGSEQIVAVTAASFGEAFVRLDATGRPIGPLVMYTDARGGAEAAELATRLDPADVYCINGCGISGAYSLPKIMWFRDHRPHEYERTATIVPVADYVLHRLGADRHASLSLAARTMALDIGTEMWSPEILRAAGVDATILPTVVPIGSQVGRVTSHVAEATGLSPQTVIVAGGHDQVFAAIGAGLRSPGTVIDGMGSVECLTMLVPDSVDHRSLYENNFVRIPYLPELQPVTYAYSLGGGELVSWFAREVYYGPGTEIEGEAISRMLEAMAPSSCGTIVVPHINGAGTPSMDPSATAAIVGIRPETTRGQLLRALVNCMNHEMAHNLDLLRSCGLHPTELIATGGGAATRAVMQVKADLLGLPVRTLGRHDGGALGAALVAATGSGFFASVTGGMDAWNLPGEPFVPSEGVRPSARRELALYRAICRGICEAERGRRD